MGPEILQLLIAILAIASLLINSTVIYDIVSSRHLRDDVTGRVIISSAVSDLGSGLTVVGVSAVIACLRFQTVPPSLVLLQMCCFVVFGMNSQAHQTLIAVTRCITIVKPFTQHEILSGRRVNYMIIITWIYAFVGGVYPLYTDVQPTFNFDTYIVSHIFTGWTPYTSTIPFIILTLPISISYLWIFVVILKHRRQISDVSLPRGGHNDSTSKAAHDFLESVRSAKCMFTLFAAHMILSIPILITEVTQASPIWLYRCIWIMMLYCVSDSFLYMALYPTVRNTIKSKLSQLYRRILNTEMDDTSVRTPPV